MTSMSKAAKALEQKEDSLNIVKGEKRLSKAGRQVAIPKSERQAAFRAEYAGRPVKETMAAARLIPDVSQETKSLRIMCSGL